MTGAKLSCFPLNTGTKTRFLRIQAISMMGWQSISPRVGIYTAMRLALFTNDNCQNFSTIVWDADAINWWSSDARCSLICVRRLFSSPLILFKVLVSALKNEGEVAPPACAVTNHCSRTRAEKWGQPRQPRLTAETVMHTAAMQATTPI